MNNFGELLYAGKTDNNKNGIAFLVLGGLLQLGSNFIYAKTMLMVIGGLFMLIGAYLLLFKRSEKFAIYENGIVLNEKGQEVLIPKEQISHIEYQELRGRRNPVVNYYPILILNDQKRVLINKSFNSIANPEFRQVIESYL